MTPTSRAQILCTVVAVAALPALVALAGPAAAGPRSAEPPPAESLPILGTLLPVPAAGPGTSVSVTAVDVNPLGVVAGTANLVSTDPDRIQSQSSVPLRWAQVPRVGWRRQQLAMPAGAQFGTVAGVTNLGEAGGTVTTDGVSHAVRWSVTGRSLTSIGANASQVSAVGPNGPWGVDTPNELNPIAGDTELVTRSGERTLLSGTPDLGAGYRRTVISIGGPTTAIVGVTSGVGFGTRFTPVLWRAGATLTLPVFNSPFGITHCESPVMADGSLSYSGLSITGGVPEQILVRHVGGVPGQDVDLSRTGSGAYATLGCQPGTVINDSLAADGGISGSANDAQGGSLAAYWDATNTRTTVPLEAGEASAYGAAVATGRRMVIRSETADHSTRLTFWHNGIRTPLAVPAGWRVNRVVKLTDRGLLVANLSDESGRVRPATWNLGRL